MNMSIRQRVSQYMDARQQHPAWRLLVSPRAPLMLGCLTGLFANQSREGGIAEEDALQALAQMLLEFANHPDFKVDVDNPQQQSGRELREWIKRGLIVERGQRLYETDALNRAVQFIDSLDNRIMTSTASRLSVVQEQIRKLETGLDADPVNRADALRDQIALLQQELIDVEAGKVEVLPEATAVEAIREVYVLATGLSADFRRVEDSWRAADRILRQSMMAEGVHRGDVLEQLLDGQENLLNTAEGRVFDSFMQQLGESSELKLMTERIRNILTHPAAERALNRQQMLELRWLRLKLSGESQMVLRARSRSEEDVRSFIKSGLASEHHRVGLLLNEIIACAHTLDWSAASLKRAPTSLPPLAVALGNVPVPERLRYKVLNDGSDTVLDFNSTKESLEQLDDEFWAAFDGLNREQMLRDTLEILAQHKGPMSLSELAGQIPITYDLETLSLWIGMAREAGIEIAKGHEILTFEDAEGNNWQYHLPVTRLESSALAEIDWEL